METPAPAPEPAPLSLPARLLAGVSVIVVGLGLLRTPPDTTLFPFGLFALGLLLRGRITRWTAARVTHPGRAFVGLAVGFGLLTEIAAWLGHYLARSPDPALFHPQLIPDLIIGVGFYLGWALAWLIVLQRWTWSLRAVFLTMGLFGVGIEQQGAVLIGAIGVLPANPLLSGYMLLYVALVYGSFIGLGYLPLQGLIAARGKPHRWIKVPAALILVLVLGLVVPMAITGVAKGLGLIPPPRPIWEAPLF